MLVLKFGGTSVSSQQSVQAIAIIVERELLRQPILVVSALSNVTNLLVSLAKDASNQNNVSTIIDQIQNIHLHLIEQIFDKNTELYQQMLVFIQDKIASIKNILAHKPIHYSMLQWQDHLISHGELMSSHIIATYLASKNIRAKAVFASEVIVTNNNFGSADFIRQQTIKKAKKSLLPLVKQGIVPVVTGFIGATPDGEITTLGRGGSDYSASIIGYAMKADDVQIWTDVNGVYSADPRFIKNAQPIKHLSYQEASEIAMFGAKVLHPRTILPAIAANIPVRVLNTFNHNGEGTTITREEDGSIGLIKAITSKTMVPLINIYSVDMFLVKGFLKKIFAVFTKHDISVDLVSASEVSVSVTLDNTENLSLALQDIGKFAKVTQINDYGSVSLVGEQIMSVPHLMPKVFSLFEEHSIPVHMLSYSAANINIGIVIPSRYVNKAVEALHSHFIK